MTTNLRSGSDTETVTYTYTDRPLTRIVVHSLPGWYDFGARYYDPVLCRWTSPDPLAGKYPAWSPYAYCGNSPYLFVDPDGKRPRVYILPASVKQKSLGHVFVTTGEGKKTTVYDYGRYGALNPIFMNSTIGPLNPTGEGVLRILKGEDAEAYLQSVLIKKKPEIYELLGDDNEGDDNEIDIYFNCLFFQGVSPTNKKKQTFNNPNSRVIDTYDLRNNNCVTHSVEALERLGLDIDADVFSPGQLKKVLDKKSASKESVQVIYDPNRFLYDLLKDFYHGK